MATTAYVPKDWNTGDLIAETDLDHIENGIKAATDAVIALEGAVKQGASYRISTETFSASKADCSAAAVTPASTVLPNFLTTSFFRFSICLFLSCVIFCFVLIRPAEKRM